MTSCQVLPSSRVRWIRPTSVPTQTRSFSTGDGAMVEMAPKPQARARATGTSPEQSADGDEAAPVRSGLTTAQLWPPSSERKSTWAP